jgi:hypothetical protein
MLRYDQRPTSIAETQARQAFLNTLTLDVINPLTALKACQAPLTGTSTLVLTYPKGNARSHSKAYQGRSKGFRRGSCRLCREYPS